MPARRDGGLRLLFLVAGLFLSFASQSSLAGLQRTVQLRTGQLHTTRSLVDNGGR
jgi:hypothetical protein